MDREGSILSKIFRRSRWVERAIELVSPLAGRGVLGAWALDAVESAVLRRARRIPAGLRNRLDALERARVKATLARIVSSAGERDPLLRDADLYAEHALAEIQECGSGSFLFLSAVGPAGTAGVFRVPRRDVDAFAREVPDAWGTFGKVLKGWRGADPAVRREAVGVYVD